METFKFLPFGLYSEKLSALFTSDYHLGYEVVLNREGLYIPDTQLKKILKQLEFMKEKTTAEKIFILGDLKHEFGNFDYPEFTEVKTLFDYLLSNFKEVVVIRGNHDNFIANYLKKKNIPFYDYWIVEDLLLLHGHMVPESINLNDFKSIVMGHLHPAVTLKDELGIRRKFKAGLKIKRKNIFVLPPMTFLTQGIDILELIKNPESETAILSKEDLLNAVPYVMNEQECYELPIIKKLIKEYYNTEL